MNDVEPSKRGEGMAFQSYALYPHLNLYDNMSFGLKLSKANKSEIKSALILWQKFSNSAIFLIANLRRSLVVNGNVSPSVVLWFRSRMCFAGRTLIEPRCSFARTDAL